MLAQAAVPSLILRTTCAAVTASGDGCTVRCATCRTNGLGFTRAALLDREDVRVNSCFQNRRDRGAA
jgi:hypothetical protein